jgi:GNAT superfamily N-acetyltransferase
MEEVLASGISPEEAVNAVREYGPTRYMLCAIEEMAADHDRLKQAYKDLGYRHLRREPLFVRSLAEPIESPDPSVYVRVRTPEVAGLIEAVTRRKRRIFEEDDAPLRHYAAIVGGEAVGWVQSIRCGDSAWVANMYVVPEHRRKGIARSLMQAMMADDRRLGIRHSVLLASTAGSKLYPIVGYEQIGLLQAFFPKKVIPNPGN